MFNFVSKTITVILIGIFCHTAYAYEQVLVNSVRTFSPDLTENFDPVPGFTKTLVVTEPSYLFIDGHVDVLNTVNYVVFVEFRVKLNGLVLRGSKTGENIEGLRERFYSAQIHGFKELDPGTYTIELEAKAVSEYLLSRAGLAEVRAGYNQVLYRITPKTDTF